MKGLSYLTGLMLADGGLYLCHKRHTGRTFTETVFISDEDESFVTYIATLAGRIFNLRIPVFADNRKNMYYARTYRKHVFDCFSSLGVPIGRKAHTVRIPL